MKIPFACAFKELLASYDNTNHYSYLLNFGLALFFPARYKACRENENMANITLNCLIIPTGRFTGIPNNNVTLIVTIPLGNAVRNLHTQIQQLLPQPFRNVPFYLRAYRLGPVKYVAMREGSLISDFFDENLTADVCHILVEEDVYGYYN
ncbi:hypothetical protein GLOIN_2v523502 [Rhizophagus irregularis DAOM 181602=DAOM 197198]|uniref:Uncharacterized protein n=1 Tax=Rhizophagus irregularis (strain DAOM 181602 / DAOM 197198 / MUCL 43194) TaxID=747089 RepID=A0A2P4PED5_RHIID|nr:hypothetical protein GLOIN_2v523502 [Rhizophagus irregularis DAOM 181602=DAOM 197198]POG63754.1 hypothetical protein GLOIN_2v523502 [Rhizophagus irregularis DAOM 181602=DAOM 197198]|eukprot:XP_025170620.1 hypothetical protein GLOIN_2v523502 [Rhizophagus irregularis DAOM 181602=DAOM 197198]